MSPARVNICHLPVAEDIANMRVQPDQENQELIDNLLRDLDQPGPSGSSSH